MKATIKVTAAHIREGKQYSCERCPVALAMAEGLSVPVSAIAVGPATVTIRVRGDINNQHMKLGMLPKEATKFIETFDKYGVGSVAPFTFTFEYDEAVFLEAQKLHIV